MMEEEETQRRRRERESGWENNKNDERDDLGRALGIFFCVVPYMRVWSVFVCWSSSGIGRLEDWSCL